jgi:ABC-type Zn uptake system ZnuABC Zn-binding protein ZnuA
MKRCLHVLLQLTIGMVTILLNAAFSGMQSVSPKPVKLAFNEPRLRLVASLFPLYDFAKQVVLNRIDATLLLPPGLEAHHFEPRPSDPIDAGAPRCLSYNSSRDEMSRRVTFISIMEQYLINLEKGMLCP